MVAIVVRPTVVDDIVQNFLAKWPYAFAEHVKVKKDVGVVPDIYTNVVLSRQLDDTYKITKKA
ncbi:hypothetical protein PsorP6_002387 [Peronosclerospora sorghi]|uniref:Uncharacterized protein n=1 Tax=Peronosclerospora sorghi TaxID=230839 RepID=A0ACC0WSV3_9STRA|nr:hypothetical protein PsorP6_002387 [Peronosclerospora sorghi]